LLRSSEFSTGVRDDWIPTLPEAGVGLIALLLTFAPTWLSMAHVWSGSEAFGHGFLVAPIAARLVWRRRTDIAKLVPRPSWLGVQATSAYATER